MNAIDSYNSDKVKLQESITGVYNTILESSGKSTYNAIEEESKKLVERQELIYNMLSTATVVAVLFTLYRIG
jgi:hypothetical protein